MTIELPIRIQVLAQTPDTVTLRRDDFEAMLEMIEDAADSTAITRAIEAAGPRDRRWLPGGVVARLVAGEPPLRVFCDHFAISLAEVATGSGVSVDRLAEIDNGSAPDAAERVSIARSLGLDEDQLTPWSTA
jgi:hypothetical protein